ncbi:MAG: regulator, partial [Chlorobi bacterium]|nr:regulator [Chlorobiota bacterium]
MKRIKIISIIILSISLFYCSDDNSNKVSSEHTYIDKPFIQEYHVAYPVGSSTDNNDVRSIAVDSSQNIWIATKGGVFIKKVGDNQWQPVQDKNERGPSYTVAVDSDNNVWFGTWNGLYKYVNGKVQKIKEVIPPISMIAATSKGVYAFGHNGNWLIKGNRVEKLNINISKGIRDAIPDNNNGIWIASDVGLYHYANNKVKLYQDENELISSYIRGISYSDDNKLWAGGLGGVTIRDENRKLKTLTPKEGISNAEVNCVEKSPDSVMWVGTNMGIVRYAKNGSHSLRFSKRWLMNDKVRDIAFDKSGTAWIATAGGVSAIKRKEMTLSEKEDYFYNVMMRRHVREPWIVYRVWLDIEGDTASWRPWDDDNDGEYTAIYLSMESLRYAVTKDKDAREKAKKAFHTLKFLQEVTETDGFFARTVVPSNWEGMNDRNRKYTEQETADELVKDPRFKK